MFVYYMNVPLNELGIYEFEKYDEVMKNVKTFELTEDEYIFLRQSNGLFQVFDNKFGTMIDICEEERIEYEHLEDALSYATELFMKHKSELADNALKKVVDSIKCAIDARTFWEIDIYLD